MVEEFLSEMLARCGLKLHRKRKCNDDIIELCIYKIWAMIGVLNQYFSDKTDQFYVQMVS